MTRGPTIGTRVSVAWDNYIKRLTQIYNYKEKKNITRSDMVRMLIQAGAPVISKEFKEKYGDSVELEKGADPLILFGLKRNGDRKRKRFAPR